MPQPLSSVSPVSLPPDAHDPPRERAKVPVTERVAGWSIRHRKTAVFGWLLLVAAIFVAAQVHGTSSKPTYDPGQAGRAERVLQQITNDGGIQPSESVLISAHGGGTFTSDPAMHQAAAQVVAALGLLPRAAADIQSPLSKPGRTLISPDGRSILVTFTVPGSAAGAGQAVQPALQAVAAVQAAHPDLTVAEAGDASLAQAADQKLGADLQRSEYVSVPITLALLLVVFGALVAAGIPLLLAITAVLAATSLTELLSGWLPITSVTDEVVLIIGLAVGVDYSLFYLRREREERAAGRTFPEALRIASRTSGRAIVVSGVTVMITMASLFLTGLDIFTGAAAGTIAVVGVAVAGSLTALPALLSWLGPRADGGRVPFLGRRRAAARPSRFWAALVGRVIRHPAIWGGVAALALIALAAPALGMRLGQPIDDAPAGIPEVQTISQIQAAFGQSQAPAEIVVTGNAITSLQMGTAVSALRAVAASDPADHGGTIGGPVLATMLGGGRALLVEVTLAGNGSDAASYHALTTLESKILPETLGKVPGISYAVTGDTAQVSADIHQIRDRLPLVLIVVGILALVLLLAAFRSLAVSLVSVLLNLLSVGAAYGLITLIFQDGRLQGLLGYTSIGAIIWWVPLFMFVLLFGISMDYNVFILSRIRERRLHGASTGDAVVSGIASSAGVVTSAALIMVAVFSIFATMSLVDLKILGVGTAAAIVIDATVVRGVLLPAALTLLGDRASPRA
jgi:putative drug exporter of the RND superfamily